MIFFCVFKELREGREVFKLIVFLEILSSLYWNCDNKNYLSYFMCIDYKG